MKPFGFRKALFGLSLATLAMGAGVLAAQSSAATKAAITQQLAANSQPGGSPTDSSLLTASPLKITITPSETPLKLGSTSNIAADIQNVSNVPVEIDTSEVQLMVHAILSHTDTLCVTPLRPVTNTNLLGLLVLQPQDHVSVLFNLSQEAFSYGDNETAVQNLKEQMLQGANTSNPIVNSQQSIQGPQAKYRHLYQQAYKNSCDPNMFGPLKRAIDFTPGSYDYFVTGKFSVCDPTAANPCPAPSRSFSESATFQVGIDQVQIIIFAIVGGLLAYLVVAARGDGGSINRLATRIRGKVPKTAPAPDAANGENSWFLLLKTLRDIVGVAILSAAFTIVSSRLSDSQFPIKVSVLDAWGAMTIGFLSYFVGNKFIDSLRNLVK
ncbi:MAG TPA: hypothetical protein VKR52_05770 [Terracidiphilus sp.]|nr:hypothetical protein [Terracidiphilus sp.]